MTRALLLLFLLVSPVAAYAESSDPTNPYREIFDLIEASCDKQNPDELLRLLTEDKRLASLQSKKPIDYCQILHRSMIVAGKHQMYKTPPGKDILCKLAALAVLSEDGHVRSIGLLSCQINVFLQSLSYNSPQVESSEKCKAEQLQTLLTIWMRLSQLLDESKDREALPVYQPPADYSGLFVYGVEPSHITDDKVRKEYASHLKERNRRLENSVQYGQASRLKRRLLQATPSIEPIVSKELERSEIDRLGESLGVAAKEIELLYSNLQLAVRK